MTKTLITAAVMFTLATAQAQAWTGYILVPTPNGAQVIGVPAPQQGITDQISAWQNLLDPRTQGTAARIVQACGRGGEAKIFDTQGRVVGVRICPLQ